MHDSNSQPLTFPTPTAQPSIDDPLTAILRHGAKRLLAQAVEAEVDTWIDDHAHLTNERGRRQVVRNGYAQPRQVVVAVRAKAVRCGEISPMFHRLNPFSVHIRVESHEVLWM